MSDPHIPIRLQDLSLSAKLTYLAIREHGPLKTDEVVDHIGVNPRTVRRCVETLYERGEISIQSDLTDARKRRYKIPDDSDS